MSLITIPDSDSRLALPVEALQLSGRSSNCLREAKIATIADLLALSDLDLLALPNFGPKSLREIRAKLDHLPPDLQRPADAAPDLDSPEVLRSLRTKASDLPLSFRNRGNLRREKIHEIWQLVRLTEAQILMLPNMGHKSLKELAKQVEGLGLRFGMQFTPEQLVAIQAFVPPVATRPLAEILGKLRRELRRTPLEFLDERENLMFRERFLKVGRPKIYKTWVREFSVTGERVRQVEKAARDKVRDRYRRELREVAALMTQRVEKTGGLAAIELFEEELAGLAAPEQIPEQILVSRILALTETNLFIDWQHGLVSCRGDEWIEALCEEIRERLRRAAPERFFTRRQLEEATRQVVQRHGLFPDGNHDNLLRRFQRLQGISALKNLLCFGPPTRQDKIGLAFKKFFPQGLDIYKRQDELLQRLREFDAELPGKAKPGSLLSRLTANPDVLLWGRGFFIHRDHISYDPRMVERVAGWIEACFDRGHSRFRIDVPFKAFQGELAAAGIPNPYALYTLLRLAGHARIGQRRYPVLAELEAEVELRQGVPEELENYLAAAGRAVSYKKLEEEFLVRRGWKSSRLQKHLAGNSIFPWRGSSYIHRKHLRLDETGLETLLEALRYKVHIAGGAYSLKRARREMKRLWERTCPGASLLTMIKLILSARPADLRIEGEAIRRVDGS